MITRLGAVNICKPHCERSATIDSPQATTRCLAERYANCQNPRQIAALSLRWTEWTDRMTPCSVR
jgi:hypothetical protein